MIITLNWLKLCNLTMTIPCRERHEESVENQKYIEVSLARAYNGSLVLKREEKSLCKTATLSSAMKQLLEKFHFESLHAFNLSCTWYKEDWKNIGKILWLFFHNIAYISVLINRFVLPIFYLCSSIPGINFRGMLHQVYDVVYEENKCGPIRASRYRGKNWLINCMYG